MAKKQATRIWQNGCGPRWPIIRAPCFGRAATAGSDRLGVFEVSLIFEFRQEAADCGAANLYPLAYGARRERNGEGVGRIVHLGEHFVEESMSRIRKALAERAAKRARQKTSGDFIVRSGGHKGSIRGRGALSLMEQR